jgi:hypothetical protein
MMVEESEKSPAHSGLRYLIVLLLWLMITADPFGRDGVAAV